MDAVGNVLFGKIHIRQKQETTTVHIDLHKLFIFDQVVDHALRVAVFKTEQRTRRGDQLFPRKAGVSVLEIVPDNMQHTGAGAVHWIDRVLHPLRDLVGADKADPDLCAAKAVGILCHALNAG